MPLQELDEFDFHDALAERGGISAVMFFGPDCGACRMLESSLPRLIPDRSVHLFKVNVQKATSLARAYDVFHLPSLFVFVEGEFHGPLHAEATPEKFSRALTALLDSPAQEEP
jgi:thioredoxin-like negative regulator of GroEL